MKVKIINNSENNNLENNFNDFAKTVDIIKVDVFFIEKTSHRHVFFYHVFYKEKVNE